MHRPVMLGLALVLGAGTAQAQDPARPDTARAKRDSAVTLPTLTVTRAPEAPNRAPVATAVLDQTALRRAQLTVGLDEALSNIPGVFVSNRYNFSVDQRISIRGAGSRSNFGARGVKILLDGVPQTLPDGQSQLTNVDFGALDRIEVLRGASGSLYGNASGGVIAMLSEGVGPAPFSQRLRVEYGSFGTDKWQSFSAGRIGNLSGTLSVSRFTSAGFRQNSYADIRMLNGMLQYALSGYTSVTVRVSAADDPHAQNPGALTAAEYAANPDSAAANNIRRGADKDVTQQQLSIAFKTADTDGNELTLTAFGVLRDLTNPLATPPPGPQAPARGTYSAIGRQVGGLRAQGSRQLGASSLLPRLTVGADLQRLRDNRTQAISNGGAPTANVFVDQREKVTEVGPFAQITWSPTERLFVSAGTRYDWVTFDVLDHIPSDGDNSGSRTLKSLSGNGGVSYELAPEVTPYVNVSTSFDTPTTTELANRPDRSGGFNDLLNPQRTVNVEFGARGRVGRWVNYTASVFRSTITDAIVSFTQIDGTAFFTNAGRVRNEGVELGASVTPVRGLQVFGSYTFANYRFRDYTIVNGTSTTTLTGKRLAGVPRNFTRLGLRTEPGWGLAFDVDHTLASSIFADDANTQFVEGWGNGITNARLSWSGTRGQMNVAPFIGVNNLWDRNYIGSVTINGTFGRVLEPAPRRNVYAGAEIGFKALTR